MNIFHRYHTVEITRHAGLEALGGPAPEFVDLAGPALDAIGDPEGDFYLKLVGPTSLDAEDFAPASPRLEAWVNANRPMHGVRPEKTGRTVAIRAAFEREAETLLAGDIEAEHFAALAGVGVGHFGLAPRDVRDVLMSAISMHAACQEWDSTAIAAAMLRGIPNKTTAWPSLAGAEEIAARLDAEDAAEDARNKAIVEAEAPADAVTCEDHGVIAVAIRRTLNGTGAVPPELLDFPGQTSFVDRVQDGENFYLCFKRADIGFLPVPAKEIGWGINVLPDAVLPAARHQVRDTTRRVAGDAREFFLRTLRPAVAPGPLAKTYDYKTADGHFRAELGESLTAALRMTTMRGDFRAARLWLEIEHVGLSRAADLVASEALAWVKAEWATMHPAPPGDGLTYDYGTRKMVPWAAPRMPYPFGDAKELEREMGLVVSGQGRLVNIDECYVAPSQATIDRLALGMSHDEIDGPIATFAGEREMFQTEDVVKVLTESGAINGKASPRMLARIKHSVERLGYRKTQKIVNGTRSWYFVRETAVAS